MEDYSNDFSKFVQNAVDKAKELGGIAKLHAQIKARKRKSRSSITNLGRNIMNCIKTRRRQNSRNI